ncbi:hypothetical protein LIA77_04056 [Sarocladium implicatum]|nr:hypothetical protein LIA77_04056 [Sarocladium implicatum]
MKFPLDTSGSLAGWQSLQVGYQRACRYSRAAPSALYGLRMICVSLSYGGSLQCRVRTSHEWKCPWQRCLNAPDVYPTNDKRHGRKQIGLHREKSASLLKSPFNVVLSVFAGMRHKAGGERQGEEVYFRRRPSW